MASSYSQQMASSYFQQMASSHSQQMALEDLLPLYVQRLPMILGVCDDRRDKARPGRPRKIFNIDARAAPGNARITSVSPGHLCLRPRELGIGNRLPVQG